MFGPVVLKCPHRSGYTRVHLYTIKCIIIYTVRRTMTGEAVAVAGRATRNFRRLPAAPSPAPASEDDRDYVARRCAREVNIASRSHYSFICILLLLLLFIKIVQQISTGRCLYIPKCICTCIYFDYINILL